MYVCSLLCLYDVYIQKFFLQPFIKFSEKKMEI